MSDSNDPKAIWRSQPTEIPTMPISYLRHRATELEKSFRIRSVLEQGSCLLAIAMCLGIAVLEQEAWKKLGAVLCGVGGLYAFVQWRRRTAKRPNQTFEAAATAVVFYRRELERKRDIHRSLWRWYLLPCFLAGTAFLLLGIFFGDLPERTVSPWLVLAVMTVVVTAAAFYENYKAAQYQREIDALSALEGR